jgi:hypothetical protein
MSDRQQEARTVGPLTRRISARRNRRIAVAFIQRAQADAERKARIAVALFEDKDRDGGLLIHRSIEQAEA